MEAITPAPAPTLEPISGRAAYEAAHHGAVIIDLSAHFGRFELIDRDRLDLLHRMSTNDMNSLSEGEGRATVLTTALARIIDQLVVYHQGDTALAIAGPAMMRTVRLWLQKHIFFNDRIKTRDISAETVQIGLYGAQAAAVAARIAPGAESLPMHHFLRVPLTVSNGTESPLTVARSFPIAGGGFTLIAPASLRDALLALLTAPAEAAVATPIDATAYGLLRIESGVPEAGRELTEEYIPLEAGLWDAVSFSKGCYIGQEIIARMESRNKLARVLVTLTIDGAPVTPGTPIAGAEKEVGVITSACAFPVRDGEPPCTLALGYIRTEGLAQPLQAAGYPAAIVHSASAGRPT